MHPNGQLPAYEWAFGDVNPPVHAWAAWQVYQIDRNGNGRKGDLRFPRTRLSQVAAELHLVGQSQGRRRDATSSKAASSAWTTSAFLTAARRFPTGGYINQADGTSWMAMYSLNLMRIAAGAGAAQPRLRRHRHQILRALPLHRRGHDQHRRRRASSLWDEAGRVFLRRADPRLTAGRPS